MIASLVVVLAACSRGDAPTQPAATPTPAPAKDRFVAVGEGVVRDSRTNLEWTRHDYDQALAWDPADLFCRELVLGERSDWRLPEITELQALYEGHAAQPCGDRTCHLDPAIRWRSPYVWSGTSRGPGTRFYFDFVNNNSLSPGTPPTLVRRVLCVHQPAPPAG